MTERSVDVGRGISLCLRTYGDPAGEPLVLVAGLGMDLTSWSDGIVQGLVSKGFYVITFDNRDAGASVRVSSPPPNRLRQLLARPRGDAYDLDEMAADTIGLLDGLDIERAHLVGMSMGGMIAQTVAAGWPDRTLSLTSISSTTGDRRVGQPALSTMFRLASPPARNPEQYAAHLIRLLNHIGSATYPFDAIRERSWAIGAWHRGPGRTQHEGIARQVGAIQKSGDRTAQLGAIIAPTLVVHGDTDRMVHPTGGVATAAAIPGARHVVVKGLGHHLPPGLDERIVELIADHALHASNPNSESSLRHVE